LQARHCTNALLLTLWLQAEARVPAACGCASAPRSAALNLDGCQKVKHSHNRGVNDNLAQLKEAAVTYALRHCDLFSGLSSADLIRIASITAPKMFKEGEYLFHEGEPVHGFYIVQKGAVNIHRTTPTGKEKVIHIFREGESFAEAALASTSGYPADARAVAPSQVLLIQKEGFMDLLRSHPELMLRMMASISAHLKHLVEQMEDLALKDVETRLANWLLKRCPDREGTDPVHIQLTIQKRVLAAELGTSSETFSRTLAKFRELELIAVDRQIITVLAPNKLSAYLRAHLPE